MGTVTATDAENVVFYGIAGGVDANRFTINGMTGALSFNTTPDFEAPTDNDGNNVYNLIVSASDGIAGPVTKPISVTVTNVDETPLTGSNLFGTNQTPSGYVSGTSDRRTTNLGPGLSRIRAARSPRCVTSAAPRMQTTPTCARFGCGRLMGICWGRSK